MLCIAFLVFYNLAYFISMFHWIGPVSHCQLVINVLCVRWSYDRIKTNQAELVRDSNNARFNTGNAGNLKAQITSEFSKIWDRGVCHVWWNCIQIFFFRCKKNLTSVKMSGLTGKKAVAMAYPRGWSEVSWFEVCCYLAITYHRHLLWLSSQNVGLLMLCRDTSIAVVLSV